LIGFKSLSNSYTSGTPVGIFKLTISSSEILSKYLTNALKEFPWATIKTFLPIFI